MKLQRGARGTASLAILGWLGAAGASAQPLRVTPTLVDCVEAGRVAAMAASFRPADRLARATLYFRAGDTRPWYSVEMRPQGGRMVGLIPPPLAQTTEVDYYLGFVDSELRTYRTAPFRTRVVTDPGACGGRLAVGVTDAPAILVGFSEGAPAMPVGFATDSLVDSGRVDSEAARAETAAPPEATRPSRVESDGQVPSNADATDSPASEASTKGGRFPAALALLGAGEAAVAVIAASGEGDDGSGALGAAPPVSGPVPEPTPTPTAPSDDRFTGLWLASVTEAGEVNGVPCDWTSRVLFEFRLQGSAVSGTATTSITLSSASECGGREPVGEMNALEGRIDAELITFRVSVPAAVGEPVFSGTLQGNVISGAMRRDSGSEGTWQAGRQ